MTTNTYQKAADLFQVLSHQGRVRILDELRRDEACVCHLQAVLRRPQSYVSQQLRVLRERGLVKHRKEGTLVYYRLADPRIVQLLSSVLGPPAGRVAVRGCQCPHCQMSVSSMAPHSDLSAQPTQITINQ